MPHQILSGLRLGLPSSGSISSIEELNKALTAGYGTDVASLSGGGALRLQSLDRTLFAVVQTRKKFALFNTLQKSNAIATVDEWTEQSGIGGFLGGSTNSELGRIKEATGKFNRRTDLVKFLMTKRQVSLTQTLQSTIINSEAAEHQNGAMQLLTDAEYLCFEGDDSVVPTEFNGIRKQVESLDSADHIIDAEGKALTSINAIVQAAATISGYGNYGEPTDLFISPMVGADLDANLDPAYRVHLPNGQYSMRGSPVSGITTAQGDIMLKRDVFIREEKLKEPFELQYPGIAPANSGFKPLSIKISAADNHIASKFGSEHAGNYYYYVTGINKDGQSPGLISEQVAVAAGKKCTLTIKRSASRDETGYVIYRSRKNGTNDLQDLREMVRIPCDGEETVWHDLNREIPGTTSAYMLNMSPSDGAITWRQLLPMMKFALHPVDQAVIPWAQLLFGYLRLAKRNHHVVIKNIVPSNAAWKPFN